MKLNGDLAPVAVPEEVADRARSTKSESVELKLQYPSPDISRVLDWTLPEEYVRTESLMGGYLGVSTVRGKRSRVSEDVEPVQDRERKRRSNK